MRLICLLIVIAASAAQAAAPSLHATTYKGEYGSPRLMVTPATTTDGTWAYNVYNTETYKTVIVTCNISGEICRNKHKDYGGSVLQIRVLSKTSFRLYNGLDFFTYEVPPSMKDFE